LLNGYGIEYDEDGNKKYAGEYKNGMADGRGIFYNGNGDIYSGEFESGGCCGYNGYCVLYKNNGEIYICK
jgi:hypothetical protein